MRVQGHLGQSSQYKSKAHGPFHIWRQLWRPMAQRVL